MKSHVYLQKLLWSFCVATTILILSNLQIVFAQSLKITHPTNGKVFISNSPIEITWEGTAQDELVTIEYSTNGGTSWSLITNSAKNGKKIWANQPIVNSNCILRISAAPKPNGG